MPLVLGHLDKMRVEIGSQYSHIYMVQFAWALHFASVVNQRKRDTERLVE